MCWSPSGVCQTQYCCQCPRQPATGAPASVALLSQWGIRWSESWVHNGRYRHAHTQILLSSSYCSGWPAVTLYRQIYCSITDECTHRKQKSTVIKLDTVLVLGYHGKTIIHYNIFSSALTTKFVPLIEHLQSFVVICSFNCLTNTRFNEIPSKMHRLMFHVKALVQKCIFLLLIKLLIMLDNPLWLWRLFGGRRWVAWVEM